MKNIALVTINFNGEKDTHACLDSLSKLNISGINLLAIVVDNGSKLHFSLEKKEKEREVVLIRSERNLGFTGGNNLGIEYALEHGADYVLLLNNDTLVDQDLVKQLLAIADSNPKIGAVVPKIYFSSGHEYHKDRYKEKDLGKVFWYAGGDVDYKNAYTVHRGVDEIDSGQYDSPEEIEFATGCCVLIKREVLEKVGSFDDKFFLYCEDGDLSQRIIRAGYKIMYAPKAVVWHNNAGSSGSGSNLHDYYLSRNRMIFGMRYMPARTKFALIRESIRLLLFGRPWQKIGIRDFYLRKFGKGSYRK